MVVHASLPQAYILLIVLAFCVYSVFYVCLSCTVFHVFTFVVNKHLHKYDPVPCCPVSRYQVSRSVAPLQQGACRMLLAVMMINAFPSCVVSFFSPQKLSQWSAAPRSHENSNVFPFFWDMDLLCASKTKHFWMQASADLHRNINANVNVNRGFI